MLKPDRHDEYIRVAPAICEFFLGPPNEKLSGHDEVRWGKKGSFKLNRRTGTWYDFEADAGGGILKLVMRETHMDETVAREWMMARGYLRDNRGGLGGRNGRRHPQSSSRKIQKEYPAAPMTDRDATSTIRWLQAQAVAIEDSPDHPLRAWMRQRNLWRPELPLPPSIQWIPAESSVFRGTHSGAGAIALPLATIAAWRASYPEAPEPNAVQLICINTYGERADYRNKQGNRVDKPKFGNARLAVWSVGDIRGESVIVCEGAADALALAAREPDPVVATLTTPRPSVVWREELSVFEYVTLWADMDEKDKRGRRPGLDAVRLLTQARKLSGAETDVVGVDIGKDAADAARETPLGDIDIDELNKFTAELREEGMTEFEALRYASTLLK